MPTNPVQQEIKESMQKDVDNYRLLANFCNGKYIDTADEFWLRKALSFHESANHYADQITES